MIESARLSAYLREILLQRSQQAAHQLLLKEVAGYGEEVVSLLLVADNYRRQ